MNEEPEIETGIEANVKWFKMKSWGFLTDIKGRDIFVHHSVVPNEMTLNDGDSVLIEIEHTEKGLNCTKIERLHNTFTDL